MVVSRVLDRGMIHRQGVNGAPTPPLPFHSFSIPPFFLNFTLSLPFYSFSSRRHSSRTSITIAGILRVGDEIEEVNGNRLENESIASIQALLVCARLPSFSPSSFTSPFPYTSHPPIPFLPSRGIVKDRCPSSSFRPPDTNTNKPRHLHYLFFIHFLSTFYLFFLFTFHFFFSSFFCHLHTRRGTSRRCSLTTLPKTPSSPALRPASPSAWETSSRWRGLVGGRELVG